MSSDRAVSIRIGTSPAAPQLATDLEAVHLGQHQVQHHEVRIAALVLDQGLLAVARGDDVEALLLQVQPHQLDDVALVVDDEDGLHSRSIRRPCRARRGCVRPM